VAIIKGGSAQRKGTGFSVAVVIEKNDLQNRAAIEGPR
jgi:hypothetical protein